jgi:hypothetical protein
LLEDSTMNVNSVTQSGVQGLRDSLQRADDAATRIAGASAAGEAPQLTEALVDLRVAEQQAAVSARLIAAGDSTVGTLIDLLA